MTVAGLDISVSYSGLARTSDQDELLLARLKRGDATAVATIYDEHHQVIRAFALRLLGDPAAAEDLVHEVFVSLPKAIRSFEQRSTLKTFLISIAVNHCRHYVRASARRRSAMDRLSSQPFSAVPLDPEREFERGQMVQLLSKALDSLSLNHRVAFVLCEVEERPSREAASIVGVPEATIRTRLFHAKKKLRSFLEKRGAV